MRDLIQKGVAGTWGDLEGGGKMGMIVNTTFIY